MPQNGLFRIRNHTFYERLCAKAAYGGASDVDFTALIQHLQGCPDCRILLRDFMRVLVDTLPQMAEGYGRTRLAKSKHVDDSRDGVALAVPRQRLKERRSHFRWPL